MPRAKKKAATSDGFVRWGEWPPQPHPSDVQVSYQDWEMFVKTRLPDHFKYIKLCCSIHAQLLVKQIEQPFSLVLVGPPSSGKTQALNVASLDKDLCICSDKLSGPVFLTATSNKNDDEIKEIDLLPKIRHRCLEVKDLAPIFGGNEDALRATIAQLTRVLDGQGLIIDMGTQKRRELVGDYRFMMLAASTPVPERVWNIMSKMGPRMLFCNFRGDQPTHESIKRAILTDDQTLVKECRIITNNFIHTLWDKSRTEKGLGWSWDFSKTPDEVVDWLSLCANLVALGRANPGEEEHDDWKAEYPYRASKMLRNLAIGHAILHDRAILTLDDLAPVLEVAVETGRQNVSHVVRALVRGCGRATTTLVMRTMGCTHHTAIKAMEMAVAMGIGNLVEDNSRPGCPLKVVTVAGTKMEWIGSPEMKRLMWPDNYEEASEYCPE
jgi:hypothetical protein